MYLYVDLMIITEIASMATATIALIGASRAAFGFFTRISFLHFHQNLQPKSVQSCPNYFRSVVTIITTIIVNIIIITSIVPQSSSGSLSFLEEAGFYARAL